MEHSKKLKLAFMIWRLNKIRLLLSHLANKM